MKNFDHYVLATTSIKGGCGKSMFACALVDYLRGSGVEIAAFDADCRVGTLSCMHAERDSDGNILDAQDPVRGVNLYSIRNETRETFADSIATGRRLILHDIAGGALENLQQIFGDREALKNLARVLRDLNAVLVFIHAVTPDDATVASVATYLDLTEALGPLGVHTRHIAFLNLQGQRDPGNFPTWVGYEDADGTPRGGNTRKRLLRAGGTEIKLPALDESTAEHVKSLGVPFAAAERDRRLRLAEQQRVRNFREDFSAELTPEARDLMGLTP